MGLINHELSLFKQRRKRDFIVLSMGAALEAIKHERMINHLIPFIDIDIHLSQNYIFQYLCFIQIKSSSTWVIPASLCEGTFFYFYVESSSSNFMHQLREHSCHSEYNVLIPKFIIDWFMILLLLVLKLFASSHPMNFAIPWRTSWILLVMFSLCLKQMYNFQCIITHDLLFLLLFMLQHSC